MSTVLKDLYDSEINIMISTFWDSGYDIKLGDPMNGYPAHTNVDTWEEVEAWFEEQALKHFPGSVFAMKRRGEI